MNVSFWKNRRVLITGHTGFKGSWLCLWLKQMQAKICGIALAPITDPNLFSLLELENQIENHFADIRNFNVINKIIHSYQPEIIFHLAAQPLVRYSYHHPIETYTTNVMGTVHVLESAKTCQSVKAIINVTTDKCYENKEWIWGYRENERVGGYDPYSNSKACSELVTSAYRNSFYQQLSIGLASARAGNVIGGGDWSDDRLIADIMKSLMANKTAMIRNPRAIRPWQHVLEPLSGYLILAENLFHDAKTYGEAWNFGPYTHDAATVEEIVKKIYSRWQEKNAGWTYQCDSKSAHEATFLKLDISKASSKLQWKPRLNLETTINWVVNWYQAHAIKNNMQEFTINQIQQYQTLMKNEV